MGCEVVVSGLLSDCCWYIAVTLTPDSWCNRLVYKLPLSIDLAILAITLYPHPLGARNRCCEEFCWS
jgi:hypothetical protein